MAVCVNVTSKQTHSDKTVILKPGDHPFINHESVINYQDVGERSIKLVEQLLATRTTEFPCTAHDPCSQQLLQRIRAGLIDSKLTPRGIKEKCKKLWGIA